MLYDWYAYCISKALVPLGIAYENGNYYVTSLGRVIFFSCSAECSLPHFVHPSGNPWRRSHSIGVSFLILVFSIVIGTWTVLRQLVFPSATVT